jgi:hypothetical protein
MQANDKQRETYVKAAQRLFEDEGVIEIDDAAVVLLGGDPGAYVQAWVWVSDDDLENDDED